MYRCIAVGGKWSPEYMYIVDMGMNMSRNNVLTPMGVAKSYLGEAQSGGNAFLGSKCELWHCMQKVSCYSFLLLDVYDLGTAPL